VPSQRFVPVFEHIARGVGHPLRPSADVLDFGAGAGRHVAEFRHAGYNAVGVDQQFTSYEEGFVETAFLHSVERPDFSLPFEDDSFDFVYSNTVMEHVVDPARALAEIARVLRPEGLSVHCFPSRWRPVEPHLYTPLGGRFNNLPLMRLWARLGIRNGFQQDMSPTEVALSNVQYSKTGLNYPTAREWRLRGEALFDEVHWAERAYLEATETISGLSRRLKPALQVPGFERLYRGLHTRVLVLRRPLP
jgi:SAM-dependent methyltransferase